MPDVCQSSNPKATGDLLAGIPDRGRAAAQSKNPIEAEDLVFGFDRPHEIGSVCRGRACPLCGGGYVQTLGGEGNRLPDETPLFILAQATREQWLERGGVGGCPRHYYFVSTD